MENEKQELPGIEAHINSHGHIYLGEGMLQGDRQGRFVTLQELKEFARRQVKIGRADDNSVLHFDTN